MHWMKQLEPKTFSQLQKTYTTNLAKLYERDLSLFLSQAYERVGGVAPPPGASQVRLIL